MSIIAERPNETPLYWRYRPVIQLFAAVVGWLPATFLRVLLRLSEPFGSLPFLLLRFACLRKLLRHCGENVFVGPYVELRHLDRMELGNNVSLNRGAYLDARGSIVIGDDVSVAHSASIISFDHEYADESMPIRRNAYRSRPVVIEDDVWIGAGARVLAGAHLGRRTVVAANAVVTARTESGGGVMLGGVPARVIKKIRAGEAEAEISS